MANISLVDANAVIAHALRLSRDRNLAPMTICVLDAGGHLVSAQREDSSSIMRFEIAEGKAYAALGLGRSTRFMQETLSVQRRGFAEALSVASHGKFIPVAGGLLIRDAAGVVVGAIGVTGDTADNDEVVAIEAVALVGLRADTY